MPTAGFAGDDAPRSVFPSLIGRARQPGIMVSEQYRSTLADIKRALQAEDVMRRVSGLYQW